MALSRIKHGTKQCTKHYIKRAYMHLKKLASLLLHFILSCLVAAIFACLSHTQFVLQELTKIGINISFYDRLSMSLQDLLGLLPTYGLILAFGLIIAFTTAFFIKKYTAFKSWHLYTLAGAVAMLVIMLIMTQLFELAFLASTRDILGIVFQITAGLLGGLLFAILRKKQAAATH